MKLTLKIKLLPTDSQGKALLDTIRVANGCCNAIAKVVWEQKVFNRLKIHHLLYYPCKEAFLLSAQVLIRCISKVADAYQGDQKTKRTFRPLGGTTGNMATLGVSVNMPEKQRMYSCAVHYLCVKPNRSLVGG